MSRYIIFLLLGLTCTIVLAQPAVDGFRGQQPIAEDSKAPEVFRWQPDRRPIVRNYIQQPPVIPHRIKGYTINLRFNQCLNCHNWKNTPRSGATKISLTHFKNRDGVELDHVAPRRYFCTQCHVPQKVEPPAIGNTFKSIDYLK